MMDDEAIFDEIVKEATFDFPFMVSSSAPIVWLLPQRRSSGALKSIINVRQLEYSYSQVVSQNQYHIDEIVLYFTSKL